MLEKVLVLDSRVLVKVLTEAEETTKAGLIISPSVRGQFMKGTVLKFGNGFISNGLRFKLEIVQGDIVVFEKHDAKEIQVAGESYWILDYSDILYVITNKEV